MAEINWGLLDIPDIGGNALAAFHKGREIREQKDTKAAWSAYAANPDDPNALNALAQYDPKSAIALRQDMSKRQADARTTQVEQTKQTAAILRQVQANPANYPMARQAAIQLGIPAANIPEQYDPEWVGQQVMLHSAFEKDGGVSLTNAAKQVGELGYDLKSPEGKQVLAQLINAGHSKPYVDEQGRQRLYTGGNVVPYGGQAPAAPQGAPQAQAGQQAFTPEQFRGLVSSLGKDGASRYLQRNAMPVQIANASDYEMLPAGASYIDPNGVSRVKGQ